MSERREPMSDAERAARHQADIDNDQRRGGTIKRGLKKAALWSSIGLVGAGGGSEVLKSMDGKPLGSFAGTHKSGPRHPGETPPPEVGEPAPSATESRSASEPALQSGEVDVSEEGVTGYVNMDGGDPEAMTTVDGSQVGSLSTDGSESDTGGISAEAEPDTGGISPDSTS